MFEILRMAFVLDLQCSLRSFFEDVSVVESVIASYANLFFMSIANCLHEI